MKRVNIVFTTDNNKAETLFDAVSRLIDNGELENCSVSMELVENDNEDDDDCHFPCDFCDDLFCEDCDEEDDEEAPTALEPYNFYDVIKLLSDDTHYLHFNCSNFDSPNDYVYVDNFTYDAPVLIKHTYEDDADEPYMPTYSEMFDYLWWLVD